jgi:redox-sensitive bicupin YhaK (pirin superfamily)
MSLVQQFFPKEQPEGKGAMITRLVGDRDLPELDPFLMFDHAKVRLPVGFPDHPHRGFETVAYMVDGFFYHEDSKGNRGRVETGDVQWMTAGRGILHSEMPGTIDKDTEGFQLWVNLTASKKMCEPKYQELKSKDIPEHISTENGLKVRILAGKSYGLEGKITPASESIYFDVHVPAGATYEQRIPVGWQGLFYMYRGDSMSYESQSQSLKVQFGQVNVFKSSNGQDKLTLKNSAGKESKFLLIAGKP